MNKWEYCVIGPLSTNLKPVVPEVYAEIWYLTGEGVVVQNQYNLPNFHQDSAQSTAQLLWLLGEEGWELVGSGAGFVALGPGTGETGHTLYFKRRKQEDNL